MSDLEKQQEKINSKLNDKSSKDDIINKINDINEVLNYILEKIKTRNF